MVGVLAEHFRDGADDGGGTLAFASERITMETCGMAALTGASCSGAGHRPFQRQAGGAAAARGGGEGQVRAQLPAADGPQPAFHHSRCLG